MDITELFKEGEQIGRRWGRRGQQDAAKDQATLLQAIKAFRAHAAEADAFRSISLTRRNAS